MSKTTRDILEAFARRFVEELDALRKQEEAP